ncbi:DUF4240 domain-containing protein [Dactylosporangium siamense]|uniref:DUF4240 domain-containing protein n=1 Tax=Dactylosporangium siamense TaxID=685454 RepID=A0A919PU02_9ACTN|nr:DUF4240 domain-containing protein [Dactylosporangium siamense]GIG50174.1 hypothetical protein Dsi01nite_082150 [Dactylosporangium siamense]
METLEWWDLIESARSACGERAGDRDPADDPLPDAVLDRVAALPPEEIIGFARHFSTVFDAAYLAPLWAAAYLIEGGCGDDGFMDFRSGLMLQGRAAFDGAVADPDSLADLPVVRRMATTGKGWLGCEEMLYLARNAYVRRTGSGDDFDAAFDGPVERPAPARGDRWDVEDDSEMRRRLPRLAALFLT